jgi:hypothetical protein
MVTNAFPFKGDMRVVSRGCQVWRCAYRARYITKNRDSLVTSNEITSSFPVYDQRQKWGKDFHIVQNIPHRRTVSRAGQVYQAGASCSPSGRRFRELRAARPQRHSLWNYKSAECFWACRPGRRGLLIRCFTLPQAEGLSAQVSASQNDI